MFNCRCGSIRSVYVTVPNVIPNGKTVAEIWPFLKFTTQRYAIAVHAIVVCLSVRLSVTSRSSTNTAKPRITRQHSCSCDLVAAPVSQAYVERAFSVSGEMCADNRNRIIHNRCKIGT